ncbi:hypothetical protein CA235_19000 [Sphingomonas sp. ABOLF]|nr:hypothetical protein CA235_19000 [Sphingomonas sp. ABOLF]
MRLTSIQTVIVDGPLRRGQLKAATVDRVVVIATLTRDHLVDQLGRRLWHGSSFSGVLAGFIVRP